MRSTWELKYAQYLDMQGIKWQYEPTFILSDGKVYLPDFQLSSGDIIEVKGYMREDTRIKWEMFCSEHPELNKSLVTKVEMKQLRLI
jgi:predicted nuclease of restriction endonuclease-like RecB superfamily